MPQKLRFPKLPRSCTRGRHALRGRGARLGRRRADGPRRPAPDPRPELEGEPGPCGAPRSRRSSGATVKPTGRDGQRRVRVRTQPTPWGGRSTAPAEVTPSPQTGCGCRTARSPRTSVQACCGVARTVTSLSHVGWTAWTTVPSARVKVVPPASARWQAVDLVEIDLSRLGRILNGADFEVLRHQRPE